MDYFAQTNGNNGYKRKYTYFRIYEDDITIAKYQSK